MFHVGDPVVLDGGVRGYVERVWGGSVTVRINDMITRTVSEPAARLTHAPVDWGAPLEVVKLATGETCDVTVVSEPSKSGVRGVNFDRRCGWAGCGDVFNSDGSEAGATRGKPRLRVRNKRVDDAYAEAARLAPLERVTHYYNPDLMQRMAAVIREFAGDDYKHNCGPVWAACRTIASQLPPEPVDRLLLRARDIASGAFEAQHFPMIAKDVRDGNRDGCVTVQAVLRALRDD